MSWVLRYKAGTARRDMGLGSYPSVTLAQARDRAREAREALYQGIDPLQSKYERLQAMRAASETQITFAEAFEQYMPVKSAELCATNARAWRTSIHLYALPAIGSLQISAIETRHIHDVLKPIWTEKTSTAKRLRGRLESVLSWATVKGYRQGDNPARWADNLKELLPKPSKVQKTLHYAAMAADDVPDFMQRLREREGNAARALEFAILTAARSGEVIGARWSEIDLERAIWPIPADRMKMDKQHTVPLSDAALNILQDLDKTSELVFPADTGRKLPDMRLLKELRHLEPGVTVHGFRATFRDWTAETTDTPFFIAEMALAHSVGDEVQQAYRRSDLIAKRRKLMRLWAQHLGYSEAGGKVVQMEASR